MCVGKALTGGYLTMAATLCTARVADGISRGEVPVLAHGPTFMGNPLAAAVACASIDLLLGQDWRPEVKRIEAGLRDGLARGAPSCRACGTYGCSARSVSSSSTTRSTWRRRRAAAVREGVWLRPFRDLVYTMPPYVTGDDGRGPDRARGVRGGAGGLSMTVLVITGTGTEVGKTVVTAAVAAAALAAGRSVAVLKPAQTGRTAGRAGRRRRGGPARGRRHGASNSPAIPSRWRPRRPPGGPVCAPVRPHEVAEAAAEAGHRARPGAGRGRGRAARPVRRRGRHARRRGPAAAARPVLVVASAGLGTLNTTALTARDTARPGAGAARAW